MRSSRYRLVSAAYAPPAALLRLLGVRFAVLTHPDRIGHLCIEPDCYLKERGMGLHRGVRAVFLVPERSAANKTLLELWSRRLTIVRSRLLCRLLLPFMRFPALVLSLDRYAVAIDRTAECAAIFASWKGGPLLSLPQDVGQRGRRELEKLGLPAGAWFVCVHSREGGYSPGDEHLHAFRNSDIESYRLAMQAIVERGGWCVRMGDPTVKRAPPMHGVIDYAHSASRSDWMDVYLCASCRFFLGNSSGLYLLSAVFGVPSALANLVPLSNSLPVSPTDIGIPKLLGRMTDSGYLSFPAAMASAVANYRFAELYEKANIRVEQNSEDDIRDLALEMLERCSGTAAYTAQDEELQKRMRALFRPGHYSFGAASRIGRQFLRKHEALL
jgi:putative glycosyltransferase (TIGR04372 family)